VYFIVSQIPFSLPNEDPNAANVRNQGFHFGERVLTVVIVWSSGEVFQHWEIAAETSHRILEAVPRAMVGCAAAVDRREVPINDQNWQSNAADDFWARMPGFMAGVTIDIRTEEAIRDEPFNNQVHLNVTWFASIKVDHLLPTSKDTENDKCLHCPMFAVEIPVDSFVFGEWRQYHRLRSQGGVFVAPHTSGCCWVTVRT
jgi:hypothetical protein